MITSVIQVKTVYSFVVATVLLEPSSPMDNTMIRQIHPYACKSLCKTDPMFKNLYDQVQREGAPHLLGTGMAANSGGFSAAFLQWLKCQGVAITDVPSLIEKQIFLFAGTAQNPRDGNSFRWCVLFYFDI